MTQSDYPIQELKRRRPKTHWIWYIATIAASLLVGLSIAFAMQQTHTASSSTKKIKATVFAVNQTSNITHVELSVKPQQVTADTAPAEKSETPYYSSVSTKTGSTSVTQENQSTQHKQSIQQKTQTTSAIAKQKKPHSQSKSNQGKESKPNPPKETPPSKTPETPVVTKPNPVPPSEPSQHHGPIIRIVDHLTNTVEYLLTGKIK